LHRHGMTSPLDERHLTPAHPLALSQTPAGVREAIDPIAWLLRFPLFAKLLGANLVTALATAVALYAIGVPEIHIWPAVVIGTAALLCGLAANVLLVVLALRPLRDLEATVRRVGWGDYQARVPASPLADHGTRRVARTINALLDEWHLGRTRLRTLETEVIRAGDRERATLARDLHDSTAQRLVALVYQLSAVQRDVEDSRIAYRLAEVRTLAGDVLDEIRTLAHTAHPRVLEDLGILAALNALARTMTDPESAQVTVTFDEGTPDAVRNALRHANATDVTMHLAADTTHARLCIGDNGSGFDMHEAERRRAGLGLCTMRERVALVGGTCEIETAPGEGTSITATLPMAVRDSMPRVVRVTSYAGGPHAG
jgi:signal transduction histidine kinase